MTTVIQSEDSQKDRYLIFKIDDDFYGLKVHYLKEVFQTGNILKLPRTSSILEGIVNLRGYIVSIFNISILLWGKESQMKDIITKKNSSKQNIILLVTIKGQDVGILVDQIHKLDNITKFIPTEKSHLQGRQLLNPSLISQIGLFDEKKKAFILHLEDILGGFINHTKPVKEKEQIEDDDLDFDFDQYTLPDPEESSGGIITDDESNNDLVQLNLPEDQLPDKFDQDLLEKTGKKKGTLKKDEKVVKETTKTKKNKKSDKSKQIKKESKKSEKEPKKVETDKKSGKSK